MFWFGRRMRRQVPFETQIEVLAKCGIRLRADCTTEEVRIALGCPSHEAKPYVDLLLALGGEVELEVPVRYFSDDVWHFDTECIEDDGDYGRIVQQVMRLAKGQLPLTDIRDRFDFDHQQAWIEVQLDGATQRYEPVFNNDWADPLVFVWLGDLIAARGGAGRLVYFAPGDQSLLIGYVTPEQVQHLRKTTGIKLRLLP